MFATMNKILAGLCALFLSVAAIGGYLTYKHKKEAHDATMLAQELKGQKEAAVAQAQQKETERVLLQVHAQTQLEIIAKTDNVTISQLRDQIAKMKLQHLPETPIEHAQGDLIVADDLKVTRLESVVDDLQKADKACDEEIASLHNAILSDDNRTEQLERALSLMPKARPWSAVILYGKDDTGRVQIGGSVGRSFGVARVEILATQRFYGVGVGVSW